MKIGIVATHAHALPSPPHTGDSQVILDLCWALTELGHEVTLFAPEGSKAPCQVVELPCGDGFEAALTMLVSGSAVEDLPDVFHDFSIGKSVARKCMSQGFPFISTLLGGCAYQPLPNTVVWSEAMRNRVMRGATDYEGTAWPDKGGPACEPFKDARVAHGGVDTEFYSPGGEVGKHFLWLNRWSPEKGPMEAVEIAKATGIELVMCGVPPVGLPQAEASVCMDAMWAADGCPNIRFEWLPADPDHHEAKRNAYRRAKALLYPVQFQEPFGLSMVEAMACGTPVLGYMMGSVREVLGDTQPLRPAASFSGDGGCCGPRIDRVAQMWNDGIACSDLVRAYAVDRFDRRVMAANYLKLYAEVCGGGGWG